MSINIPAALDKNIKQMISERLHVIEAYNESLGQRVEEDVDDGVPHLDFTATIDISMLTEQLEEIKDTKEEVSQGMNIESSKEIQVLEIKLDSLKEEAEVISSTISKMLDKLRSQNPKINDHLGKIRKILSDYIDRF